MTNAGASTSAFTARSRTLEVADTGAHGPPVTPVKRAGGARRALAGALLALMAAGTLTAAANAPAQAAPAAAAPAQAAPVATAQPVASTGEANHAAIGTYINFANDTRSPITVRERNKDQWVVVAPGETKPLHGSRANVEDMAGTIFARFTDTFFADNPTTKSCWLDIGGHTLTNSGFIRTKHADYQVTYDGLRNTFQGVWKQWTVKVIDKPDYEFVHHTDEDDGVKGLVVNETNVPQFVSMGGGTVELKPRQQLLFYDAHKIQDGRGTFMRIKAGNTGMYDMSIIDPYAWTPRVEACLDGQHFTHTYIEGETNTLPFDNGYTLQLHRHPDGPLSNHDNKHTSDWAKFTITIKGK